VLVPSDIICHNCCDLTGKSHPTEWVSNDKENKVETRGISSIPVLWYYKGWHLGSAFSFRPCSTTFSVRKSGSFEKIVLEWQWSCCTSCLKHIFLPTMGSLLQDVRLLFDLSLFIWSSQFFFRDKTREDSSLDDSSVKSATSQSGSASAIVHIYLTTSSFCPYTLISTLRDKQGIKKLICFSLARPFPLFPCLPVWQLSPSSAGKTPPRQRPLLLSALVLIPTRAPVPALVFAHAALGALEISGDRYARLMNIPLCFKWSCQAQMWCVSKIYRRKLAQYMDVH
jgi:hypothetical protein